MAVAGAFELFVEAHEVAFGQCLQAVVAEGELVAVFFDLDIDPVELAELLGVALRLYGQVLVGDGCPQADAVADEAVHLQVKAGVEAEVLVVAEADAAGEISAVLQTAVAGGQIVAAGLGFGSYAVEDAAFDAGEFGAVKEHEAPAQVVGQGLIV